MTDEKTRALIAEARSETCAKRYTAKEAKSLALALADALESALTVPDGGVREVIVRAVRKVGAWCGECDFESGECGECAHVWGLYADAILAAFPVLSRDIAGEIEAEAKKPPRGGLTSPRDMAYQDGLRRAAEIARGS